MPQHINLNAIDGYTTTAPGSTVLVVPDRKPITIVESSYDATTKRWYRKYSDGWIEQGGYYSVSGTWGNYQAFNVNFGSGFEFSQAPVFVHCACTSTGSGSGYQGLYGVSNVSASGFTYCTGYITNANSTGFYWIAKGI